MANLPEFAIDPSRFRRRLFRTLALPTVVMAVVAAVLFWQLDRVSNAIGTIDRSTGLISYADRVRELLVSAEFALRSYLETGEVEFLERHANAVSSLEEALADLERATTDDPLPAEENALQQLRAAYPQWVAEASALLTGTAQGADAFRARVRGGQLMHEMRQATAKIVESERAVRTGKLRSRRDNTRLALGITAVSVLLLGSALGFFAWRQLRALSGSYSRALANAERNAEALRESEERLRFAAELAGLGTWRRDLVTDELTASDVCRAQLGLPAESDVDYERLLQTVHPDDRERVRTTIRRAIEESADYDLEYRCPRPDGSVRWIGVRGRPFHAEDGTPTRLVSVSLDVTERKLVEEAIRAERAWLQAVVDRLPVPVLFVEPGSARVTFSNRAAYDVAGRDLHTVYDCTDDEGHEIPDEQMPSVRVARGERVESFEMDWHLPSGKRSLLLHGEPIPAMYGHTATGLLTFQDVSRLKSAEQAVREENRRKDEFLAILAHELRNPLAPILNALQILARSDATSPEPYRSARRLLERQVRQMARLVEDLVEVSRINSGKIELRREHVDLAEIVVQAVEAAEAQCRAAGVRLSAELPEETIAVDADAARLSQMIGNLLSNASRYTGAGGSVIVRLTAEGETEAVLRVIDDGIGIPPEILPRIFEPFVQGGPALGRAATGLGIGLSLVKRLAELHGGRVEARSEGTGRGSEFVLWLPRLWSALAASPPVAPCEPAPAVPVEALRILIVDDNRDSADALGALLEFDGHEVRCSYDGVEGLEAVRRWQPDVALLDLSLPGMNGLDIARHLRANTHTRNVVLVALTGLGRPQDLERSREAGFHHHLVKPVDHDVMQRVLHEVASRPQSATSPGLTGFNVG